jgi:class 3 adenylate cyclase
LATALAVIEVLAHVGVAARPVVIQGGDYLGRTVNLATRIDAHADAGQVLVSQSVAESAPPEGVRFDARRA